MAALVVGPALGVVLSAWLRIEGGHARGRNCCWKLRMFGIGDHLPLSTPPGGPCTHIDVCLVTLVVHGRHSFNHCTAPWLERSLRPPSFQGSRSQARLALRISWYPPASYSCSCHLYLVRARPGHRWSCSILYTNTCDLCACSRQKSRWSRTRDSNLKSSAI